jgi:hypothetical protein
MTRYSAFLLACLVALWAGRGEAGTVDVTLDVVLVSASGRGPKATYDPRIPTSVRKKLEKSALAYTRYDLAGRQTLPTAYGAEAAVSLPNRESLSLKPSANASRTHPVRLDIRVLSAQRKSIMKTQVRVRYDSPFLLHRPTSKPALLIAITAMKP